MSKISTDLIFPSGRSVKKVKQDAKKLKKTKGITLTQAQNLCARDHGIHLDWHDAMDFLKKQETRREVELDNLGRLLINNLKEVFETKNTVNSFKMEQGQFCVLNKTDDATLYYIQSIKCHVVELVYCSEYDVYKPQYIDIDLLKSPTKAQLEHNYNVYTVKRFSNSLAGGTR